MTDPSSNAPPALPVTAVNPQTKTAAVTIGPGSTPKPTLRSLSRRISSRTTDLLAIAIVLIAGLSMGQKMVQWWQDDQPSVLDMGPLDNLNTEWGANSQPVSLEFGNSPVSMTRQVLESGGGQAALDAVRLRCQAALNTATPPDTPADKAEQDQLEVIAKLTPDTEQPGSWQLYTIGGAMPAVVGVKTFSAGRENSAATGPAGSRRVICWGLVFPGLSQSSWTAYTFVRKTASADRSTGTPETALDLSRFELPAECQRTVLMQESGQSALLGFQGTGQIETWKQHFTSWLGARGWTQAEPWQVANDGWSGRFVQREPGRREDSSVHIQFHQQTQQGVGLIQWFPGRKPSPEPSRPAARGTP